MSAETALAVRYHETGKPAEVLRVEPVELPPPGPGEARVRLLAAVINPSDLGMIGGSYGRLRELPAVAGREGLGEVVALGEGVSTPAVGTRVRMPEGPGVWREAVNAPAGELLPVPGDLPVEQAAMAFINPPTAWRLLHDFGDAKPGDWVAQNAGNSAVGVYVAQLGRKLGLNVLSLVRDVTKWEKPLKQTGAAAVAADTADWPKQLEALTGGARPKLGLNSVGGESVSALIKAMADGGEVVTFGGMVGDKVRFPTRFLIFNDLRLSGFWLDRWYRTHSADEARAMLTEVFALIAEGTFQAPVAASYPLGQALEAVAHAGRSGREGKVILKGP
jgi:NADPH:quinone reductase-like Zn-dependent oxidoreductase